MFMEILKALVVLTIAVPFIYIVFDVIFDIIKRCVEFYKSQAKPVLVRIKNQTR